MDFSFKKIAGLLTILCLISFASFSQLRIVTIKVVNATKQPIPYATVKANPTTDTSKPIQKITDSAGLVKFEMHDGAYTIKVTSVSYVDLTKKVIVTADNSFTFTSIVNTNALQHVTVTSTKPVMRQEDDKTIVDPEVLAASSTNGYEILEKTPGLYVDQDGNVYLSSTTPAKIYINGREQKMSTTDIATMLKSLPPTSILNIEILRTPSAKYDASGSGGIVNVVLKKGVRIGFTGSANIGMNQGVYGNQFVGLNLNNSSGKLNTYLNLQYNRRNSYDEIKTVRLFSIDSILKQDAYTRYPATGFYIGAGFGYELSKRWEINYDLRVNLNSSSNNTLNGSNISRISTGQLITSNIANVDTKANSNSISQSVTTKFKIDSSGSEWTTDFSYTGNPNNTHQNFITNFNIPTRAALQGNGAVTTKFDFYSIASNALLKLSKKVVVETGFKSTLVRFDNNANYFTLSNGVMAKDQFRTAAFRYKENINSAYLQASKNFGGIIFKAGVRAENTNMVGNQLLPKDTSFNIHRTDLFPYVYVSRDLLKIMGYELKAYLVYRRTISRPSYDLLNPFPRYVDQYLFETGNPALRPQFTKNYEANISVNERPIFAIGVNDTKDIFTNVIYQADSSKSLAYRTYDNLGTNKETYFRILGALPPGRKYFIVMGAQYNQNFYQGLYENKPLSFKRGSWSIFTYQTLKLTKTTQFTLNGFARFNGQLQFYELSSFGSLNSSINQQFFNKKMTVSLSATDLLFTNKNHFTLQQGSVNAIGYRESDTRRFGINVRYNFGFKRKEESNIFNVETPEKSN